MDGPAWEDWRAILNGIIYRFRTGCQWNHLPEQFGDDSTVHRWFTKWCRSGALHRVWSELSRECEDLGELHWEWQAADGWLGKAWMGGDKVGENSTDRAKNGTKKSIVVEQDGGPLGVNLAPANRHDSKLLRETLEAIVLERPNHTKKHPQHLCLDKGYDTEAAQDAVADEGYVSHTARIDRGEGWVPADPKEYRKYQARMKKSSVIGPLPPRRRDPRKGLGAGWWSAPWPGSPSAVAFSSATTRT